MTRLNPASPGPYRPDRAAGRPIGADGPEEVQYGSLLTGKRFAVELQSFLGLSLGIQDKGQIDHWPGVPKVRLHRYAMLGLGLVQLPLSMHHQAEISLEPGRIADAAPNTLERVIRTVRIVPDQD